MMQFDEFKKAHTVNIAPNVVRDLQQYHNVSVEDAINDLLFSEYQHQSRLGQLPNASSRDNDVLIVTQQ